jgi:3-hydroxyisobutyrate dehydrogenase-like beta-hydroxyacid dehydrogenase
MNLGVIGLGMMGRAIAQNLLKAGHGVTVWNRTRSRAEDLRSQGALIALTPADACKDGVVITCLSDDDSVTAVVLGDHGIASVAAGCIHISMSTLGLDLILRLSKTHGEAGQRFIAAPVFGRPDAAAAGRLLIVASGDVEAIAKCQPVFDGLGQRTIVVGSDPAAAPMVKLVGNFLLVSAVESLAEAMALLRKSGTDPEACFNFLTDTLFSAPVYKNYAGLMLEHRYDPGFRLALGLKDIGLVLDAAESFDVPMPAASLVRERILTGIARGYQDKDLSTLALVAAEASGLRKE